MPEWLPFVVAIPVVAVLMISGFWANHRYARFEQLPAHYDLSGRATRMASRTTMVWLLPILFSGMMLAIAALVYLMPRETQGAEPAGTVLIVGLSLTGSQALVLLLTERWARSEN